jgi:hypothetical protein
VFQELIAKTKATTFPNLQPFEGTVGGPFTNLSICIWNQDWRLRQLGFIDLAFYYYHRQKPATGQFIF